MIGLVFAIFLFLSLISYNYLSKVQSNNILIETLLNIGLGALFQFGYKKLIKHKRIEIKKNDPEIPQLSNLLGFKFLPILLSIILSFMDMTILYFFTKIIYKSSLISFLNLSILTYLFYYRKINNLSDCILFLILIFLYINSITLIISEKYPSEINFIIKINENQVYYLNNQIFKFLWFDISVFIIFMFFRNLLNWVFSKIYKQQLLIIMMNYIHNPLMFPQFSNAYINNSPLLNSFYYGISMIIFSFLISFGELKLPFYYLNDNILFLIIFNIIYCISIINLVIILLSYNFKSIIKYQYIIDRLKHFIRDYNEDNDLILEAKNKGSDLMISKSIICLFLAIFSFIFFFLEFNEKKFLKPNFFQKIFQINRLELNYKGIYLYFGIIYTIFSIALYKNS